MPRKKKSDVFQATTHVVAVIDKTGSMLGLKQETITGFNKWRSDAIDASQGQNTLGYFVLFDTEDTELCNAIPIADTPELLDDNYRCYGYTALYDAVAKTVNRVSPMVQKDDRVLFCIVTDGKDNRSKEFSARRIREIIRSREKEGNWTFIFLCSDPEAWEDSLNMGIRDHRRLITTPDEYGTQSLYGRMSGATVSYMASSAQDPDVDLSDSNIDPSYIDTVRYEPPMPLFPTPRGRGRWTQ